MLAAAVSLPGELIEALIGAARESPEREICGLIGQGVGGRLRGYPVANVAADPARRFCLDPRGQIDAFRRMRERGEALYAIYHSHPRGEAEPSVTDLAEATYSEALYLIVAPAAQGPLLRAFLIRDGAARELAVTLGAAGLNAAALPSADR